MATGVAAAYELWRSRNVGHLSIDALHLVLGLGLLTLGLMAVVNEFGWQVNHSEFRLGLDVQKTSEAWSHAHVIVNHLPTIGLVFALAFYITALALDNAA